MPFNGAEFPDQERARVLESIKNIEWPKPEDLDLNKAMHNSTQKMRLEFARMKKAELDGKFAEEIDEFEAKAETALDEEVKKIEELMAQDAEAKATREVEEVFGVQIEGDVSNLESDALGDAEQKADNEFEDIISGLGSDADNVFEDTL